MIILDGCSLILNWVILGRDRGMIGRAAAVVEAVAVVLLVPPSIKVACLWMPWKSLQFLVRISLLYLIVPPWW